MFDFALVATILDIQSTQKIILYGTIQLLFTYSMGSIKFIFFFIFPKGKMLKLCPVVTVIYFSDF